MSSSPTTTDDGILPTVMEQVRDAPIEIFTEAVILPPAITDPASSSSTDAPLVLSPATVIPEPEPEVLGRGMRVKWPPT